MASEIVTAVNELITPTITAMGYELLGCIYSQGRRGLLRVYIDSEQGITLDDCQRVSQQVGAVLDVEDLIPSEYSLEVSSPGLDRPLFIQEHFRRVIGRKVHVRTRIPIEGRRNYTGLLKAVTDDGVLVEVDGREFVLLFEQIDKANLVPDF